ncbi:acylphosphatase [Colletotrichum melonis]|uniref:acylphosphatase n=1 Tax=Colletotrichum melonis TaxID=1209925 RepID=A0AAI9U1C3_9PEZI|nr:acylphosphatase [Colletotrichum melonis]
MVKRIYFLAHGGQVQGVGFRDAVDRYFTQKRATEYGLTGWCRNTDNNKVSFGYFFFNHFQESLIDMGFDEELRF